MKNNLNNSRLPLFVLKSGFEHLGSCFETYMDDEEAPMNGITRKLPIVIATAALAAAVLVIWVAVMVSTAGTATVSEVPRSCTIFTASYGRTVLFGNNEDFINPNTFYWVTPSGPGKYGVLYLGFDNLYPQGGVNEKGLAFDWNGLSPMPLNIHSELPKLTGELATSIMENCATVEAAIAYVRGHSAENTNLNTAQIQLADATSDAVVISTGRDGELAFTRKAKGDGFLISTNFNLAYPQNGYYPCSRYDTATNMLKKLGGSERLTVEYARDVLDATHQGFGYPTLYSNVIDLRNGIMYLYYWHHFGEVVVIHVADAIAKTVTPLRLSSLFSPKVVNSVAFEYKLSRFFITYMRPVIIYMKPVRWVWLTLVLVSLVLLVLRMKFRTRAPWFMWLVWVPVVIAFGPLGLLLNLLLQRKKKTDMTAQSS